MTSTSSLAERARRIDRRLWILVVLAIVSLAVACVAVSRSVVFHARSVEVTGASHLSEGEVVALAGVSERTNVPWLDEGEVESRLGSHPWIAAADVRATLPWSIRIGVVERVPVAIAVQGARRLLVASDGTILGSADRERGLPPIALPPVGGIEGPTPRLGGAARALGAMDPALRSVVRRVDVRLDGTVELRLEGGVRVHLGLPSELARKAQVLTQVLAWAEAEGEHLRAVNLVAPGSPAVSVAP